MSTTPKAIGELLTGINRFNPDNLPVLENYVMQQVANGTYDKEANLTVLKLYQFCPNLYQPDIVMNILLKAITQLPMTDLALCKYLLDLRKMGDESLSGVIELGDLLERCNFREFWVELQDNFEDKIEGFLGFEDSVRTYISYIVSLTYQRISRDLLKSFMGIASDVELHQWVVKNKWVDRNDGLVFITSHDKNLRNRTEEDPISLDTIVSIADVFRPKNIGY